MDRPDPPPAEVPAPVSEANPERERRGGDPEPGDNPRPPEARPTSEAHPVAHAPGSPRTPDPSHHRDHSAVRTLLTVAVVFVSLFLVVRTAAVEPFGVPTGSMAPALIGNHREAPCPRCGYPVRMGAPSGGSVAEHYAQAGCPNCLKRFSLAGARDLGGDRLLVDKNVFGLRRPRRWEMAVFHCPDPAPQEFRKPYVKRVVGLPGETILIADGDVYANGELLRKGLPEVRETRVAVFDSGFVPNPAGWADRFLVEPRENDPRLPPATGRQPERADPSVLRGGVLTLDGAASPQAVASVTYRNWNLDSLKDDKEEPIRAWSSYDGYPPEADRRRPGFAQLPPAHDFSVGCEVEVLATSPGEASFACRLFDGADAVEAEVSVGPRAGGSATLARHGKGGLASAGGVSLEPGRTHRVEFSFVDRRAILALDGREVFAADLPAAAGRGDVSRPLQFGARGCRLAVRNLRLYRDTYYTQFGQNGTQPPRGEPEVLGPDRYFMLGDNSGNSQDSRVWRGFTPAGREVSAGGVPETWFIGKPFLIHQPLRPGRVTLGGQERVFQTVDWSRLRWLH